MRNLKNGGPFFFLSEKQKGRSDIQKEKYIASCSFGKDSIAAITCRIEHGEPVDEAVYCRIMFDDEISAELPEHEEWIHIAKKQVDKYKKLLLGEHEKLSGEIKRLSTDVLRLKNNRESLFEDYSDGKITKEQYLSAKSDLSGRIEKTEAEIVRLSDEINRQEQSTKHDERYNTLSPFDEATELTPEMMALVDGIYVFDGTHIEIKFAFSDVRGQA